MDDEDDVEVEYGTGVDPEMEDGAGVGVDAMMDDESSIEVPMELRGVVAAIELICDVLPIP